MIKKITIIFIFLFILNNVNAYTPSTNNTKSNRYILTYKDKKIINKVVKLIEIKTKKEWTSYKEKLIKKIEQLLKKVPKAKRADVLLSELLNKIQNKSSKVKQEVNTNNINIDQLKTNWLNWHNTERNKLWLKNFSYDDRLISTANEWSQKQKEKWSMDHKRFNYSWFYDYNDIEKWFNDRWVNCKVKNRSTSSESIWYYSYFCKKDWSNCTQEANKALKWIFDLYMAEKWKSRSVNAHYRAITHKDFTKIWFWVAIEKQQHNYEYYNDSNYYKIYATTHYCTEFE